MQEQRPKENTKQYQKQYQPSQRDVTKLIEETKISSQIMKHNNRGEAETKDEDGTLISDPEEAKPHIQYKSRLSS